MAPGADEKPEVKPDVSDSESDSDDSAPELAEAKDQGDTKGAGLTDDLLSRSKQSRSEKKARKAMSKLGLKPIPGICRVTIRKAKTIMFVISQAEVYKSSASDTYIIFGEAKVEDMSAQAQIAAAEKLRSQAMAGSGLGASGVLSKDAGGSITKTAIPEESEDEEEPDATGLGEKDIELIMQQASVSRGKAIKALRENNNDMVNAIMSLTA
ncbi:Nascent polypeptide-associated complex subunit alpha [Clonorchis sinensis]|uniref:Nascent polypeptide-associated complex subunit alpha n=1 Tax=Clonorchis sinensis TaxID=79923 RepID=A0A419QE71_CLOSI|nr:Nascent polypeptide-associated complex subunit alpha [Clonorchis sinensis]